MSRIIYTVSRGEKWFAPTKMLVDTLRNQGDYHGPIYVFGDNDIDSGCECIYLPLEHDDVYYHKITGGWDLGLKFPEATILYLDSDIQALRPISPLFDQHDPDKVTFVKQQTKYKRIGDSKNHNGFMNLLERQAAHQPPINAGTFMASGHSLVAMCEYWSNVYLHGEYHSRNKIMKEQSALSLFAFKCKDHVRYFGERDVVFPAQGPIDGGTLVHFLKDRVEDDSTE